MIKKAIYIFVLAISLSACTSLQAPVFKSINGLEVSNFNSKEVTVVGKVVMNNPNEKAIDLKEMIIKMRSNGNDLGTFSQDVASAVNANSDFTIPFSISFDPKQMGESLISTALSMLSDKKLKLSFRGFVKVQGQGKKRGFKIPIIYGQSVKFK